MTTENKNTLSQEDKELMKMAIYQNACHQKMLTITELAEAMIQAIKIINQS